MSKENGEFLEKYQASKDYIHRNIANSDVLLSVGAGIANFNGYVEINDSALVLWKALQEPCTLSTLETVIEEEYGMSHEVAVKDVQEFVELLLEHQMISVV